MVRFLPGFLLKLIGLVVIGLGFISFYGLNILGLVM